MIMAENKNKVRVLLLGAGRMGSNHLRVLSAEKALHLVGVVEPNLKIDLPEGIRRFPSVAEVDPASFDAAIIATPTETHFDVAKELIKLKKNLLVEKPLASTPAQGEE